MALKTLKDALVEELQDILSAEQQITEALPLMMQKATHPELKAGFQQHLDETTQQISRLGQAMSALGQKPETSTTCEAMKGIIKEGQHIMSTQADPDVMDAMLIAAAQKVEHYEIASYGTVCTWAALLGNNEVKELLGQTLQEEKMTDEKLSTLAESVVNTDAMA
ncbi:MAG TPA: ferritin-like domain-containing protein [Abditibacteriaceae bacterium]|jgi:ferritin-like metal-binding protein YciE